MVVDQKMIYVCIEKNWLLTKKIHQMERKVYINPLIGDKAIFLKTAEETKGEYSLIEIELAPGGGNALHAHRAFTETFIPMEGELHIQLGKQKKKLLPGEQATIPMKAMHAFHNYSDKPIRFLVELRPGHTGFENGIKIAYGLAQDGLTNKKSFPKRFSYLAVLVTMADTYPAGIAGLLLPLLKKKAERAKRKGIEAKLIDHYCQ